METKPKKYSLISWKKQKIAKTNFRPKRLDGIMFNMDPKKGLKIWIIWDVTESIQNDVTIR